MSHLALGKLRVTTSSRATWATCMMCHHFSESPSYFHLMTIPYREFAVVWWERWLMRKSINEKGDWRERFLFYHCGQTKNGLTTLTLESLRDWKSIFFMLNLSHLCECVKNIKESNERFQTEILKVQKNQEWFQLLKLDNTLHIHVKN